AAGRGGRGVHGHGGGDAGARFGDRVRFGAGAPGGGAGAAGVGGAVGVAGLALDGARRGYAVVSDDAAVPAGIVGGVAAGVRANADGAGAGAAARAVGGADPAG